MKRPSFASLLPLLALALDAQAAGMGLRWGSCLGTSNRDFACDRTTGSEVLVASFSSPATINMCAVEAYIRITSADSDLPSWWQMFNPGSCRATSLTTDWDVSGETECADPWAGQARGFIAKYETQGPRGVDVWMVGAMPATQTISGNATYAAFRLRINHARSSGAGACDGCTRPACITVERMVLGVLGGKSVELSEGIPGMGGSAHVAKWQGGTPACGAGGSKPSTWSELKNRFR